MFSLFCLNVLNILHNICSKLSDPLFSLFSLAIPNILRDLSSKPRYFLLIAHGAVLKDEMDDSVYCLFVAYDGVFEYGVDE